VSVLFDRTAVLTLGIKGLVGARVEGLRISFEIDKTSTSDQNFAKIKIWNLSEESKAYVTMKNSVVILEVGYGPDTGELFKGDITKASVQRQGPDVITELECGDGHLALKNAKLDKSYIKGTPMRVVFMDAMAALKLEGISISESGLKIKDEVLQNGFTASGPVKGILDNLVAKMGKKWSIQDNEFVMLDLDEDVGGEAVVLSPDSGLVGNVVQVDGGVQFKALIQPELKPGKLVELWTRDIVATPFKIVKVKYQGDTHDNPWYANCEAIDVGGIL